MKKAIIWTQEGCALCEQVKTILGEGNYEERDATGLIGGADPDLDAMVQLTMQNMVLPVVKIGDNFADVHDLVRQTGEKAA